MIAAEVMVRALVSEDSDLGRWALSRALEAEGFEVHAVLTWAEASARLRRTEYDLVMAEVASPTEAAAVTNDVRGSAPRAHLVLLTGGDDVDDVRRACGLAPDILVKPIDLQELAYVALSRRVRAE